MMFSKRWLVIVLILAMCLSQVQVSAFAITSDGTGETSESLDQIGSLQLSASEFTSEATLGTAAPSTSTSNITSDSLSENTPSPASEGTSTPETTEEPVPDPTPGSAPDITPVSDSGSDSNISSGTSEGTDSSENSNSMSVSFPSAEILAEVDGVTVYSVVKVLFPCEQSENLSGLQVYNSDWQKLDPYIDPATLQPYYNIYYLSPGIYAYCYQDGSGKFESIDYTPFMVEWD